MFYKPSYSKSDNETTGKVNCPLISQWGRYFDKLSQSCELEEEYDFNNVEFKKHSNDKEYLIDFSIVGKGIGLSHIKQIKNLIENEKFYTTEINLKIKEFYNKLYVHDWKVTPQTNNDSILKNFFKPELLYITDDSIGISCSSILDEEHGLGIYIKNKKIEVSQADISFKDIDYNQFKENKLKQSDLSKYIKNEHDKLNQEAINQIRNDSRNCFLQLHISEEKFSEIIKNIQEDNPENKALNQLDLYFLNRVDDRQRIINLSKLETTILMDLFNELKVNYKTNKFMKKNNFSWKDIYQTSLINALESVIEIYLNHINHSNKPQSEKETELNLNIIKARINL